MYTIFDVETNGLLDQATIIHCLSYARINQQGEILSKGTLVGTSDIDYFLANEKILVGHNIIRYDIPVVKKVYSITDDRYNNSIKIDTLSLSWYLYPMRNTHGLEQWGEELGVAKPIIQDWENLSIEEYSNRCERDVEINTLLFVKQLKYLEEIYEKDQVKIKNLINYLGFKLDCVREQEEIKCKVNLNLINKSLQELEHLKKVKVDTLINAMPRDIKYKEVSKPSKMYKADETLSVRGVKWLNLLGENNLSEDYEGTVMVQVSDEPGNPSSNTQLKNWLYVLGWQPATFEHRKNKAGDVKAIPQIYSGDGVCGSISLMYNIEPALESLDMLSLINHRIGVFKGYLDTVNEEGYVEATMRGLTNTLRLKHRRPIANLPGVYKFYGKQIRGAVVAPTKETVLCGSDMSALEDTTKQHYMYFFDPEYVKQMRVPGFDPHLDIGVLSGMLTEEQSQRHKDKVEDFSNVRKKAKVINFAGIYGAGPPKIALTSGMPLSQAKQLHKIYWERNKAVKKVERACQVKTINGQMWLRQPVSGFWYSLRYMKDRFSTLNQGTGVYCFDLWVKEVRARGVKIMLQYHDEIVISLTKGEEEKTEKILIEAINRVNEVVNLNVPLAVDVQFGNSYAEIH
jgi:hypothetical protein